MKRPKISIITVCLNSEKTIARTIESVIGQGYEDLEYIIVDGNSNDNTLKIIDGYRQKFEGMRVISEPDDGLYYAMNKGIEMATGDLIGILNSDDYYEPGAIKDVAAAYDDQKPQIIYGLMRILHDGKEKRVVLDSHEFITECNIAHSTCFVSRSAYERFGTFDTKYRYIADYDLLYRFYLKYREGDLSIKPLYRIITNFSEGGCSSTLSAKRESLKFKYQKRFIKLPKYILLYLRDSLRGFVE